MGAFHRCLEVAGVPWHSVGFPSSGDFSIHHLSAEGTTEDGVAVADTAPMPPKSCTASGSGSSSNGGRGSIGVGSNINGGGGSSSSSSSGNGGDGGASKKASPSDGVSSAGVSLEDGGCSQHGVSQPGVMESTSLRPNRISQLPVAGVVGLEADVERSPKKGALKKSPPLLGERGPPMNGGAGVASSWEGSGLGLWCHPGDLERVRFCVCGRGQGLVC